MSLQSLSDSSSLRSTRSLSKNSDINCRALLDWTKKSAETASITVPASIVIKLPACFENSLSVCNVRRPETITANPKAANTRLNQKLIFDWAMRSEEHTSELQS